MPRRTNDGDLTGLKQDRFRNSRFEYDANEEPQRFEGVSRRTLNTIGGAWEENRGRRNASEERSRWDSSPFENGKEYNWSHRQGWDQYYRGRDRGNRNYGGAQLDHEGSHFGKGPRGYQRSDTSIFEDVCDALSLSPDVDASDIDVDVKSGVVYLKGTVTDRTSKRMAELEIENISGVTDVQNFLTISEQKKNEEKDLH